MDTKASEFISETFPHVKVNWVMKENNKFRTLGFEKKHSQKHDPEISYLVSERMFGEEEVKFTAEK